MGSEAAALKAIEALHGTPPPVSLELRSWIKAKSQLNPYPSSTRAAARPHSPAPPLCLSPLHRRSSSRRRCAALPVHPRVSSSSLSGIDPPVFARSAESFSLCSLPSRLLRFCANLRLICDSPGSHVRYAPPFSRPRGSISIAHAAIPWAALATMKVLGATSVEQRSGAAEQARESKMVSRLGRRVINFANLPINLLLPSPPLDSIREIALKTVPSASKIEIRRVLESLYGFEVDEVRTLNMEGKKKKRGPYLAAKPDYKKAYVTLRHPLSLDPDLFPIPVIHEERERLAAQSAKKPGVVADAEPHSHWLDDRKADTRFCRGYRRDSRERKASTIPKAKAAVKKDGKFPWTSCSS